MLHGSMPTRTTQPRLSCISGYAAISCFADFGDESLFLRLKGEMWSVLFRECGRVPCQKEHASPVASA